MASVFLFCQNLGSMDSGKMPAVYVAKYNRFVDNIITRINRILGKSYDPVRVKLLSNTKSTKTKSKKNTKGKKGHKKHNSRKHNSSSRRRRPDTRNKMGELSIARSTESESREPAFILISKNSDRKVTVKNTTATIQTRARPKAKPTTTNKKKSGGSKKKGSQKQNKKTQKARATLFGLSSIKRENDVTVSVMADHTTVKTDFVLGPLTLRVEREVGRGERRELKSATATTAEMHGRLNLRIVHGGAATLHSIKVLQPKQVRVDSADNHEKTKEFLWRRSSNIASVVSQKLAAAARSMLKPPPK